MKTGFMLQFVPIILKTVPRIFIDTHVFAFMVFKLRCNEYGFECDFSLEGEKSMALLEKLRVHFEEEHGIEYPIDAVVQMIVNRGHSLGSIKK